MTQEEKKQPESSKSVPPVVVIDKFSTDGDRPTKGLGVMGINIGGVAPIIIGGVLIVGIIYQFILPNYVTRADYNKNVVAQNQNFDSKIISIKAETAQVLATQNTNVSNQVSNLQTQVTNVNNNLSNYATKASVDTLSGLPGSVNNQLSTAKAAQDAIIASAVTNVNNKLVAQSENVSGQLKQEQEKLTSLQTQITSLVNTPKVSGVQLTANVSGGVISLGINTDQNQYVAFKVTFKLISGNLSGNTTSDDLVKALYNNPPVMLNTNVVLTPKFDYTWQNNTWNLTKVEFLTGRTAIGAGYQSKTMSYAFNDLNRTYEVLIEPIIDSLVGSGGSNW